MIGYINMLAIRFLNGIEKPCDEIIRTTNSFDELHPSIGRIGNLHTTRQSAYLMCLRQAQWVSKKEGSTTQSL
jgi:hypothetical protein